MSSSGSNNRRWSFLAPPVRRVSFSSFLLLLLLLLLLFGFEVSNPIPLTDSSRQVEMEKREVGKWINHPRCAHSLSLSLVSIGAARISENVGGRKEEEKEKKSVTEN